MTHTARTLAAFCAVFALALSAAGAQKANITYVEGVAQVKTSAGRLRAADFGGTVTYGESVITGKDGLAELTLPNGSVIRVTQNSVFSYSTTGSGTDSRPVLATTAGKVSYKLNKATGRSPLIQTNSMVAGVRGTEFTVFAGRDGSVLLAVTGGIVDVESQGKTVALYKDEAVEVEPGKAPGEKFVWLGKELDFSSWNQGKTDEFLANPIAGIDAVASQLEGYRAALDALKEPYAKATDAWRKAADDYKALIAAGDKDAIQAFQKEVLFPAEDARATLILNIRYHALNYLSVRRYVLANMYMEMKSRFPIQQTDTARQFFARHAELLARYEANIVKELNTNDY
jgi:hypothetical protein